jgi:glycylpeptide N-tetradecanoyltransferase
MPKKKNNNNKAKADDAAPGATTTTTAVAAGDNKTHDEAEPGPMDPAVEKLVQELATGGGKSTSTALATSSSSSGTTENTPPPTSEQMDLAQTKNELMKAIYGVQSIKLQDHMEEKSSSHQFWSTQPVPQGQEWTVADTEAKEGEIEKKVVADVQKEPYPLPGGYEWSTCDLNDETTCSEVYNLLSKNYVEDDDCMFRFDYSRDFLRWAVQPPGYDMNLHIGVRMTTGKRTLVGFITGIPADVRVHKKAVAMVEINYLCVHKKLRSKRLAPVLIKEVTRRVNLTNVWQAVYTAGVVLPRPVAKNRYWHRSLNPKKLIDVGFSRLQPRMTMVRTIKLYKVDDEPKIPGFRKMEPRDYKQCCKMLNEYLANFGLYQHYNEAEFAHWLGPRAGVVDSFVVEDPKAKGKITDMCSFYCLPSSIIGHREHTELKAAYSFYNVARGHSWEELMADALIMANRLGFDVFNALDVMENEKFLKQLNFGIGDGHLQYYLYNYRCKEEMVPSQVGLVLL